jgi:hypothetical protein
MLDLILRRDRGAAAQSDLDKLASRVADLESAPKPKAKDRWDIFQIIIGAASPIGLAILAYVASTVGTNITNAINQRQLEVNTVKEMQPLVVQLVQAKTPDEARVAAVGLASYGTSAIEPLRTLLRSRQPAVVSGAAEGLRSVATSHPKEVCTAMRPIFTDRTKLYSWDIQQKAIELTGQFRCTESKHALEEYAAFLGRGTKAVEAATAPDLPVDDSSVDNLRKSVQDALKAIP